jgi:hypothetical protein
MVSSNRSAFSLPQFIARMDEYKEWHFGWQRHGVGRDPVEMERAPYAQMRAPLSNQRLNFS